jgi:hypothetical protein
MISFGVNHHRAAREAYPNIVGRVRRLCDQRTPARSGFKGPTIVAVYFFTAPLANATHLRNNTTVWGCRIVRAVCCLLVFGFLSALPCSARAQSKLNASYTISLLGLTIGSGTWEIAIDNDQYSERAGGRISGVAAALITGEASGATHGVLTNDHALPTAFEADVKTSAETDTIKMKFDAAGVTDLVVEPPFPPTTQERVPVSDADRKGVLDPLSAGLVIVAGSDDMLKPQSCEGRIPVFDGRRRFDVALSFKRLETVKTKGGYQGPAIVCAIHLFPISGHRVAGTTIQHLVKSDAMEVALAPLPGTRILVPFRASIPTLVGTVVITADRFETAAVPATANSKSQ